MRTSRFVGRHGNRAVPYRALACCLLVALVGGLAETRSAGAPAGTPTAEQISRGVQLCDQADKLREDGKPAEALKLYREVLVFLPASPRAKAGVAKCTQTSDAPAGALQAPVLRVLVAKGNRIRDLAFSSDGHLLAAFDGAKVRTWDIATGEQRHVLDAVGPIAFAPGGRTLATVLKQEPPTAAVWDLTALPTRTNVLVATQVCLRGHGSIEALAFSPDGRALVAGGLEGVFVWDVETGAQRALISQQAEGVAFRPDGRVLAVGTPSRNTVMYDTDTWQTRHKSDPLYDTAASSGRVAFAPDGKALACFVRGRTVVEIWKVDQMPDWPWFWSSKLVRKLKGVSFTADSVAFSPDGRALAVGYGDCNYPPQGNAAIVWDVATGKRLLTLPGPRIVAVSPDGHLLATGTDAGRVALHDLSQLAGEGEASR